MALLPAKSGRVFAPTALQHLMDEGSPIEHLYEVCDTCATLLRREREANETLFQVSGILSAGPSPLVIVHLSSGIMLVLGHSADWSHVSPVGVW